MTRLRAAATVAAITFTAPLFVTLGAVFLLGEKIRYRRIGALVLGLAEVMIVLRPGLGDLVGAHSLEIHLLQNLAGGISQGGIEFHLFLRRLLRFLHPLALGQGHGHPAGDSLVLALVYLHLHLGHQGVQHAFQYARVAPEYVEGLAEQFPMVLAVDEDGKQRPVKVLPAADPGSDDGAHAFQGPSRTHGQTGGPQHAREMHDVFSQTV